MFVTKGAARRLMPSRLRLHFLFYHHSFFWKAKVVISMSPESIASNAMHFIVEWAKSILGVRGHLLKVHCAKRAWCTEHDAHIRFTSNTLPSNYSIQLPDSHQQCATHTQVCVTLLSKYEVTFSSLSSVSKECQLETHCHRLHILNQSD